MRFSSWPIGLSISLTFACSQERVIHAPAAPHPRASERAQLASGLGGPSAPLPPVRSEPAAASAPLALPVEEKRCELGAGAAGLFASDAWPAGRVALTFDDGPHPGKTPKVLDLLAEHGMRATFFLVGRNIDARTFPLVQRMVAEGHALATHSYNHDVEMATRGASERTIEYIRGQHVVTSILIDLALMAKDADDFEHLYERVFEKKNGVWLASGALRTQHEMFSERHAELLAERKFSAYPVLYSRPPGGGPYVADGMRQARQIYDRALGKLGLLNVMWNGESGDTHPQKKHDYGFLTANLRRFSKRGGVLLIHDYIRTDALRAALGAMAKDSSIEVVSLDELVETKFRCGTAALRAVMSGPSRAELSAR